MVVSTRGRLLWTALANRTRAAMAADMARHARRHTLFAVFAPLVGTCPVKQNGKLYSMLLADNLQLAQNSSLNLVGIAMATARMLSGSRRSLLATGTTLGVTTARVTARVSGVLQRTVATARITCTWIATVTMRSCTTTARTMVFQFVV